MSRDERGDEEAIDDIDDEMSDVTRGTSGATDDDAIGEKEEERREAATDDGQASEAGGNDRGEAVSEDTTVELDPISRRDRTEFSPIEPHLEQQADQHLATVPLEGTAIAVDRPRVRAPTVSLRQTRSSVRSIELAGDKDQHRQPALDTLDEVSLSRVEPGLQETVRPGAGELEVEDPFHAWVGGAPYGTGRPAVVVHVSPVNRRGPSLALLERRLRDEYTQHRGGRPRAKRVRLVANKPKIPDLSDAVITFDLTGNEWTLETEGESVVVERDGKDALEYVAEVARTTFAGELGYLVVNVPEQWRDPVVAGDVIERIRRRLDPGSQPDKRPAETVTEPDSEAPLVAVCEPADPDTIDLAAQRYWFGTRRTDTDDGADAGPDSVEAVEAAFERGLSKLDWLATPLTEQDDAESTEHYRLKAAVTAAAARQLYDREGTGYESRSAYVVEELLGHDTVLETEYETESGETVDLYVHSRVVRDFVPTPDDLRPSTVAIEIETGRSQAAADFRKIWHTVERLPGEDIDLVSVIVPPRVLLQRKAQAVHIQRLISLWNLRVDAGEVGGPHAVLNVPVFDDDGDCTRLRAAKDLIEEVYDDTE